MKIMKKILIGLLVVTSVTFSANAQETRKMKNQNPHHGKGMMMKGINLNDAQKEQMKANREATKKQMMELNKNELITVKEYKERKASIQKSQKDQMDKLLTPEQKNQIAQNKIAHQKKQELHAAKKLDRMKSNLNLSDDQVSKIKANQEASHAKVTAIRENSKLRQDEKKEQLMALKETQKNSFEKVLTLDQLKKMEEMRKNRPDKGHGK
jgi:hypothetical protein